MKHTFEIFTTSKPWPHSTNVRVFKGSYITFTDFATALNKSFQTLQNACDQADLLNTPDIDSSMKWEGNIKKVITFESANKILVGLLDWEPEDVQSALNQLKEKNVPIRKRREVSHEETSTPFPIDLQRELALMRESIERTAIANVRESEQYKTEIKRIKLGLIEAIEKLF